MNICSHIKSDWITDEVKIRIWPLSICAYCGKLFGGEWEEQQ